MKNKIFKEKGFTLIELLLVIGILVILISATIVAINPARQFAQANNAARFSGVTTLMNAVYQNIIDNAGKFCPDLVTGEEFVIPSTAGPISSGGVDIYDCLIGSEATYLSTLPLDPQDGKFIDSTDYDTGYTIMKDSNTLRITIAAPSAEIGEVISLTR